MRTIVDFTPEQLQFLADMCEREGISRAEAVRRAVEKMQEEHKPQPKTSWEEAVKPIFGMWKDREDIGDSVEYIRNMRKEWDREWDEK